MKSVFTLFICLMASANSFADNIFLDESAPPNDFNLIEIQRSCYGGINANTDNFGYNDFQFQKYDMHFERTYALRAIYSGVYISTQRSLTNLHVSIPDAIVETTSVGFAATSNQLLDQSNLYFIASLGAGVGTFTFKNPNLDDWEAFGEANLEAGFKIAQHLLLGAGFTYQLFGSPGITKAELGSLYVSAGISF